LPYPNYYGKQEDYCRRKKMIIIVLEINDPETVDAYSECDKSFIEEDLRGGTLLEMCDIVEVVNK
jgi:hypothetical protein